MKNIKNIKYEENEKLNNKKEIKKNNIYFIKILNLNDSKINKNKSIIPFLTIILFFIIFLIYNDFISKKIRKIFYRKNFYSLDLLKIWSNDETYDSLEESCRNANYYIKKSYEGLLFKNNFELSNNPQISVVMPVYNSKNTIKRALTSIQNQNFSDFEIIIINDYSNDSTLLIMEEIQKKDKRINIINNKQNMGILYSRCIGVLASKGKYIFPLDNDDMILNYNIFNVLLNEAEKDKLDILEFTGVSVKGIDNFFKNNNIKNTRYNIHENDEIIYQPELSYYPLNPIDESNYRILDFYLWQKLISSEVYKKSVNLYGEKRYSKYVIKFENLIINYIIFQNSKSFKSIGKHGILRIHEKNTSYKISDIDNNVFEMYFLETVVDFSKETKEGKSLILPVILKLIKNKLFKEKKDIVENKNLFDSILKKIFSSKIISEEYKNKIKKECSQFKILSLS